jgi:hypothetical protein
MDMKKRIAAVLTLAASGAYAGLDRAGNVLNEDGEGAAPRWVLIAMAVGSIIYGLKNPDAPDRGFAIGLGVMMLFGMAVWN